MQSINPHNGEVIAQYEAHSESQIQDRIDKAQAAFESWRETSFEHRAARMRALAQELRKEAKELALLMANEMGKVLKDGEAEVEKCAVACEYYAENASTFLRDESIATDATRSWVRYQPLGIVLAVMPWNFPFWQVIRFAAPGLMAGNVGLLKHASNVSGCSLALERLFHQAGFPDGVFTTLLVEGKNIDGVISHPHVKAVTLTGSTPAGKSVASAAGHFLKKCVLELGGSDPYLVLADADLEKAAAICAQSRLINAGQSCIAAKRFIIAQEVYERFSELFVAEMKKARLGPPTEKASTLGPQARVDLRDSLHKQVERSLAHGATLLLGGRIEGDPKGAYYPPTVLGNVEVGMPAFDEELFGPVAALIRAKTEDEAIQLANQSEFGLGAAVFSRDTKRAEAVANRIEAGSVFINALVKSDPRLPFGGIKDSGYGRELSYFGIREFVNIKTLYQA